MNSPYHPGTGVFARLADSNKQFNRSVRMEAEAETPVLYLYDVVDEYWGVSARQVIELLDTVEGPDLVMRINSPGGDVIEARAIVSAMRNSGKNITAVVDGIAASSASWIATAANSVQIAEGAFFMVHSSWSFVMGNAAELREIADLLEKVDGTIRSEYIARTGADEETVNGWLAKDTWFTAEEAVEAGLAGSVVLPANDSSKAENRWNLDVYDNAPKFSEPEPEPVPKVDLENLRRRVRLLANGIA